MTSRVSENHSVSEGRLLAFIYETLEDREKKAVEQHLMTCLRCQMIVKKLDQMKVRMENEPKPSTNETWQGVREMSGETARKNAGSEKVVRTAFGRFREFISRGFVIPVGAAAAVLMVFGFMTLGKEMSVERIHFLKASEGVTLNGQKFFERVRPDYPVNKRLNLGVGEGECAFQLGKGSVVIAEKDTEFMVEYGKYLTIRLVRGSLIAKVNRLAGDRELRIATPMGSFTMTSAVFYVRNDLDYVECGVREGELKSVIGERTSVINEMTGIRIDSAGKEYALKMDLDGDGFSKLDSYKMN